MVRIFDRILLVSFLLLTLLAIFNSSVIKLKKTTLLNHHSSNFIQKELFKTNELNVKSIFDEYKTLIHQTIKSSLASNFIAESYYNSKKDESNIIEEVENNNLAYIQMKEAEKLYQAITIDGDFINIKDGEKILLNNQDERIDSIAKRLKQEKLFTGEKNDKIYDNNLFNSIVLFQNLNGLKPDGVIGSDTIKKLNVTAARKLQIIQINLNRIKDSEAFKNDEKKFLRINIPSYYMEMFKDGKLNSKMKIVVGKPSTPTPRMVKNIYSVTFNPVWSMPHKIAKTSMLSSLKNNPDELYTKGVKALVKNSDGGFQNISLHEVNWDEYDSSYFPFILKQDPGKANPLGHVRFNLKDGKNIFLHGTANQSSFNETKRALSLGCIRTEEPDKLAEFVLEDIWDKEKILTTYNKAKEGNMGNKSEWVNLKNELPVYFIYLTSWVDEFGYVNFYNDIYNLDKI